MTAFHMDAAEINPTTHRQMFKDDGEIKKKWDAARGSFQFEILKNRNGNRNFQIDMSVIYQIEEVRHETEVRYLKYNDFIRIKILPKSVISGDYEHLELMKDVESFNE